MFVSQIGNIESNLYRNRQEHFTQ